MIDVTNATDAELVVLWHRLNHSTGGFWSDYDKSRRYPANTKEMDSVLTHSLWSAVNTEMLARGIRVSTNQIIREITV